MIAGGISEADAAQVAAWAMDDERALKATYPHLDEADLAIWNDDRLHEKADREACREPQFVSREREPGKRPAEAVLREWAVRIGDDEAADERLVVGSSLRSVLRLRDSASFRISRAPAAEQGARDGVGRTKVNFSRARPETNSAPGREAVHSLPRRSWPPEGVGAGDQPLTP